MEVPRRYLEEEEEEEEDEEEEEGEEEDEEEEEEKEEEEEEEEHEEEEKFQQFLYGRDVGERASSAGAQVRLGERRGIRCRAACKEFSHRGGERKQANETSAGTSETR